MSSTEEIVPVNWPTRYTQVPVWLMLAGISAQALRIWIFLAEHINNAERGRRIAWPTQPVIARALGLEKRQSVGPYCQELVGLKALKIEPFRYDGGMRKGLRYYVHFNPPEGYSGPITLKEFYGVNGDLQGELSDSRAVAAQKTDDGGAEKGTSGGTESGTSGSTSEGTSQRPVDGTSRGAKERPSRRPSEGTSRPPADGTSQGRDGGTSRGPVGGPEESEDQVEEDQVEEETSPSSVGTAEVPRARTPQEEGARTDDDQDHHGPAFEVIRQLDPKLGMQPAEVMAVVPLLNAALNGGHTVGFIRDWLNEDLPSGQIRRRAKLIAYRLGQLPPVRQPRPRIDPLAPYREAHANRLPDELQALRAKELRTLMRGGLVQADLVDVDEPGQLPGQLGVPMPPVA